MTRVWQLCGDTGARWSILGWKRVRDQFELERQGIVRQGRGGAGHDGDDTAQYTISDVEQFIR